MTRGILRSETMIDDDFLGKREFHDDTDIDLVKIMNHFQENREHEEQYAKSLHEKFTNFDDLRKLLKDTGLISEAICENGR